MSELIGWGVALILALIGGGVGWNQILRHGRALEQRDRAREAHDAASNQIARRNGALPDDSDFRRRLERLRDDAD